VEDPSHALCHVDLSVEQLKGGELGLTTTAK
jgi:hypothetical protein